MPKIPHDEKVKMGALEILREARAVWKADGQISMDQALKAVIHYHRSRFFNTQTRAINRLAVKLGVPAEDTL